MAPPSFTLTAIDAAAAALGRAAIFICDYWDGVADIALTHVGYSEGAVEPAPNGEYDPLVLSELMAAPIRVFFKGEAPVLQFSVLCATQAQASLFSPTGSGSAGTKRWREVQYKTLVLFPESLFINAGEEVAVAFDGAQWTIDGTPATAAQQALIDMSMWFWKGYFTRATPSFNPADGGKALRQIEFHSVQDLTKPDGEQLYTLGDPADAGIDIAPAES